MRSSRVWSAAAASAQASIRVETDRYELEIPTSGYVSGVKAGSFLDKATGARDLGFGLSIVDFLLEPGNGSEGSEPGQYEYGPTDKVHGNIAKRYVEGPQICTQAQRLSAQVFAGEEFVAVKLRYRWHVPYAPRTEAGSIWEQTLVFPRGERFFLSADRVTTVQESKELFFRIDMPGHIRHDRGGEFEHIYLSYNDPAILPSTEFLADFPPDGRFLYKREADKVPERFIRAYQVNVPGGKEGPWLAGMTLAPGDVYQAWCHQRGYVCLIEEIGGLATKPGDTFGACYLIGWFDGIEQMEGAYDRYRGWSGLELLYDGMGGVPSGFRGVRAGELKSLRNGD